MVIINDKKNSVNCFNVQKHYLFFVYYAYYNILVLAVIQ